MNGLTEQLAPDAKITLPEKLEQPVNQWILDALNKASETTAQAVHAYRFNEAADTIYQFVWNIYCDWYLEFIKPVMAESAETQQVANYVLYQALHLLAPFMPFITEELNEKIFTDNTFDSKQLARNFQPWECRYKY